MKRISISILILLAATFSLNAQRIAYTEPDKDDNRNTSFEVIGKMNGNYLIYKSNRDRGVICRYDNDMKLLEKNELNFLPDKVINADFLAYADYSYMFYQYQKRNIVYCMAVKFDANGKQISDPVQLDTTEVGFFASNKIYSLINSENKQKIMTVKVNTKDEKAHIIITSLFDKDLVLLHNSRIAIPMPDRNDFITEFQVDNDGDLVFLKETGTAQNDNISKLQLLVKAATSDEITSSVININGLYLDDIKVKVDNYNKHYLATSFYSKQKRGNIEGLYCYLWNPITKTEMLSTATTFNEEFRSDAKGENSLKMAFNDYFLRNVIMKKDGGFLIAAEAAYTSTRGGSNSNRWDYGYGSPYGGTSLGYSYGSPYSYYYPWSRYNNFSSITRYYADNIAIISFDSTAKTEWSNVVRKSQYDDNSDAMIGYTMVNGGDQLRFLYNVQERRDQLLSEQSIDGEGQIIRSPTLKNLDLNYEFMPRFAKQVGQKQIIVPCMYRNYICFAKIDLQ